MATRKLEDGEDTVLDEGALGDPGEVAGEKGGHNLFIYQARESSLVPAGFLIA